MATESGLCPRYHRAIELIGRRWTGAIVRTLTNGPRRFNELLSGIPGISDRLLTERLRELEAEGVVRREVLPESPVRVMYELTPCGRELQPALDEIGRWAERWIAADTAEATEA
ncbi:MAG TPA: winged helix-turn-helix transcriptional regulator [Candidatus Baltobacteraceae bacterium]|nr:winged helix-turn-helix transcriptional regulator [Candidatus Baltobacteraceae bacterium]